MKTSTLPPLTIADLESTPDDGNRYELIDGEIFVSAAPSYFHQSVLMNIATAFLDYLRANPIGKILPGVGVVVGGRLQAAPEIAIEILSPGASNERRIVTSNLTCTRRATWVNTGSSIRKIMPSKFTAAATAGSNFPPVCGPRTL